MRTVSLTSAELETIRGYVKNDIHRTSREEIEVARLLSATGDKYWEVRLFEARKKLSQRKRMLRKLNN
jgi:hypothetical protein